MEGAPASRYRCPVCGADVAESAQRCLRCMARFGAQGGLAPVESSASETPAPRRFPVSGVIAVACFFSGILSAIYLGAVALHSPGGLGGAAIVGALAIGAGSGLGALASIVAIIRKERWLTLHVIVLIVSVGTGLWIISLFRPVSSSPTGPL